MKKTILTSICSLAVAGAAFAQGNLQWTTISPAYITVNTNATSYSPLFGGGSTGNGTTGATAATGGGFYYELLYTGSYNGSTNGVAPTSLTALGTWSDTGLEATNTTSSTGKLTSEASNAGATVSGMTPGTTNYIILVGWSANLGTTWATAESHLNNNTYLTGLGTEAFFGVSNVGFITPYASTTSPGAVPFANAAQSYGTPIYSLNTTLYEIPVTIAPEPGTMALAAIGGASLLLFRRRK